MVADGALDKRLAAIVDINKAYAEAIGKQHLVPSTYIGGANGQVPNSTALVDMLLVKTSKEISDLTKTKGGN
jgi:hypothetical protein